MKLLLSSLALFFFIQTASPCINKTGTKLNGDAGGRAWSSAAIRLKGALATDISKEGTRMEAELRGATEFERRSDYAVALMYLGRSKEAVTLLEQLEKERPGQYFVAANLGTAHELSGNNEEALRWITEGIRRDPESHLGTEWLHVKILEAKIAHAKGPKFFDQHSVLNLDPASIVGEKELLVDGKAMPWEKVGEAIQYQLGERLQFIKGNDPSVASLLFDYAAIEAARNTLESARPLLKMALEFGYPAAEVQPLLKLYDSRIEWRERRSIAWKVALGVVIVGGIIFLIINRIRAGKIY